MIMFQEMLIAFSFGGAAYTAVVTRRNETVSIYFPDKALHHIIPEERVDIDVQKGFPVSDENNPKQDLIITVLAALEAGHHF